MDPSFPLPPLDTPGRSASSVSAASLSPLPPLDVDPWTGVVGYSTGSDDMNRGGGSGGGGGAVGGGGHNSSSDPGIDPSLLFLDPGLQLNNMYPMSPMSPFTVGTGAPLPPLVPTPYTYGTPSPLIASSAPLMAWTLPLTPNAAASSHSNHNSKGAYAPSSSSSSSTMSMQPMHNPSATTKQQLGVSTAAARQHQQQQHMRHHHQHQQQQHHHHSAGSTRNALVSGSSSARPSSSAATSASAAAAAAAAAGDYSSLPFDVTPFLIAQEAFASEDDKWEAVLARDPAADAAFVYCVTSTRIYCRPTCPSRRALRHNVVFTRTPAEAEELGYRACRRCLPDCLASASETRQIVAVEQAKVILTDAVRSDGRIPVPSLAKLAEQVGMSKFHFQRTFKRIVGESPDAYSRTLKRIRTVSG